MQHNHPTGIAEHQVGPCFLTHLKPGMRGIRTDLYPPATVVAFAKL